MSHDGLLEIQRLDNEVNRLRHRRKHLEQRARLTESLAEQSRAQAEIATLAAAKLEAVRLGRRLEDQASIVSDRIYRDEARLYSGEIRGLKNLEALQREVNGLRKRQAALEDQALDAMGQGEELSVRLTDLEVEQAAIDARVEALRTEIAAAETEIDHEIDWCSAARAEVAGLLDEALVGEYEELRPRFGPATVVTLSGSNCAGCPSSMPAMEVDRIKHEAAGTVQSCSECGRMVLR